MTYRAAQKYEALFRLCTNAKKRAGCFFYTVTLLIEFTGYTLRGRYTETEHRVLHFHEYRRSCGSKFSGLQIAHQCALFAV